MLSELRMADINSDDSGLSVMTDCITLFDVVPVLL